MHQIDQRMAEIVVMRQSSFGQRGFEVGKMQSLRQRAVEQCGSGILALRLDVSTDEPIYLAAGNWYILLIKQLNINSPHWLYNNEHPAFAKLLMGISINIARHFHASNQLFPARIPSVLLGTLLVVAVYTLGRAPFGRLIALLAALSLAISPWVVILGTSSQSASFGPMRIFRLRL